MPETASAEAGPPEPLAIVAGAGDLPRRLAERRAEAGLPVLLIVFDGCYAPWMAEYPYQRHAFERVGALFRALKSAGARHVVFAGAMNRPKVRFWRMDLAALRIVWRVLRLLRQGDDAMLRGFGSIFEEEGISLISPRDILGDTLTVGPGPLGRVRPEAGDLQDARRAASIVRALGALDVG